VPAPLPERNRSCRTHAPAGAASPPDFRQHAPYFHDGSAATLTDVVAIYNTRKSLRLSAQQSADLVEYLKSL